MRVLYRQRLQQAIRIFDLEDRYARERRVRGPHPRPMGLVIFRVIGQMVGGARQDFDQPLVLVVQSNANGYHLFFGTVRMPDQSLRQHILGAGTYVVRVESDFYQRAEREDVFLPEPQTPFFFDLEPGFAYPFPPGRLAPTLLRGSVRRFDGQGIVGARVEVTGQSNTYVTDPNGQWVLVFPDTQPSGAVTVTVERPGQPVEPVPDVEIVRGAERSLSQAALRGWVVSGAGDGIPGASIAIAGHPGTPTTSGDGSWLYCFGFTQPETVVSVTATLPDGRNQTQPGIQVRPRSTVAVPTFRF